VPQLLYSGRYGSSKSRTLCEKADLRCRAYPGARVVIARKRRTDLGQTTLPVLLEETISEDERAWGWRVAADGGSTLYYPNGSRILVVGLDNPGKLRSGQFDLALVDQAEELEQEEWDAILGRLRHRVGPYRQLAGFCNPAGPSHFLFKRFRPDLGSHVEWTREPVTLMNGDVLPAGQPMREVVLAGAADNVENLLPDYQLMLASYTGGYRDRYVLGRWVSFEGALFDTYDERFHVRERPDEWREWGGYPPPNWKRVRSVDFGYAAPFVLQWWAISPEGAWWLYREIYRTQRLVSGHAAVAKREEMRELNVLNECITAKNLRAWPKAPLLLRLSFSMSPADHADAEARAQLEELGFATIPAIKDRDAGYQTLYEMVTPRVDPTTNVARARLYFVRDARCEPPDPRLVHLGKPTCTHEEFPLLQFRPVPTSGKDKTQPEEHLKGDDHGYDAARYATHTFRMSGPGELLLLR
jgi:phage terminase large subunit